MERKTTEKEFNVTGSCNPDYHYMVDTSQKLAQIHELIEKGKYFTINRKGFDFKEVQISEEKRLDIVITYMNNKYIVELKKWYNEEYHNKGIKQLTDYLERQNQEKGYLLIFDFRKRKKVWKHQRINNTGKELFAVWV